MGNRASKPIQCSTHRPQVTKILIKGRIAMFARSCCKRKSTSFIPATVNIRYVTSVTEMQRLRIGSVLIVINYTKQIKSMR